jgi:hypothetical protein
MRFSRLAQGSQDLSPHPSHCVQESSLQPDLQPSQEFKGQAGSGAQKSEQLTTQTVFFTSFISHTTLQYFSQQARLPQCAQQSDEPQVCTSLHASGGGTPLVLAASAEEAINTPIVIDNAYNFIFFSLVFLESWLCWE